MFENLHPAFSFFLKTQTPLAFVVKKKAEAQLLQPKVSAVGKD